MNSKQQKKQLVVVVYDGISNSVFESQLVIPLIEQLKKKQFDHVLLISFEPGQPQTASHTNSYHPQLTIKIESRFRFWGRWALLPCSFKLKSILSKFDCYTLMARGPLAGWIALQGKTGQCEKLTIQARGLAAQEYAYTHTGFFAQLRVWQYKQLEKKLFQSIDSHTTIQAVSPALKQFLINKYHAPKDQIVIAQEDIPPALPIEKIKTWRNTIRAKLYIPLDAPVYCYNGSAKPWQCPQETVTYFKKQFQEKPHAVLLVLSQDIATFTALCSTHQIPEPAYRICSVPHKNIYEYLAAADFGLLFRKKHILNWVSRPTKLLEYQAVGLQIVHNSTIALLSDHR